MTASVDASELFCKAYESRYTWDENFPGYSADVLLVKGNENYTGKIRINCDLSVEVWDVVDEQIEQGIYTQLQDVVTHRRRSSFKDSHGQHQFDFGLTDANDTVEILVKGDTMGSRYKIRSNEICQVSRVMGNTAFVIDTHAYFYTDSGYIASCYDAVFRQAHSLEVQIVIKFTDTYEKIGDYYLMTKQVVEEHQGSVSTILDFTYSNLKLLAPTI